MLVKKGRGTKEHTYEIIEHIQTLFDHPVLRTTMIVGFPSETDEDFDELMEFVQNVKWDRMGAFTYSKEEDTRAFDMKPEVDAQIAQNRLETLMKLQNQISYEKNQEKIGQVFEVLVEEKEGLKETYRGRSIADAPDEVDGQVIFTSTVPIELGTFVKVKIQKANAYDLYGICQEL